MEHRTAQKEGIEEVAARSRQNCGRIREIDKRAGAQLPPYGN